ncbi:MAG TPA: hypothetical protein DCG75_10490 [Bacteroidales bacterium]|jgi:chemotaxis protein MotB|nr:hypothetical protein [Bacteroidales bacterium]
MSRSLKLKPFWRKNKSPRRDKETKTTIKNSLLKSTNHESNYKLESTLDGRSISLLILAVVTLFFTSCVSTKKFETTQEESKQNAFNFDKCKEEYNSIVVQNKDLSRNIIDLENALANEKNKYNLLEQQYEYFKSTNTNLLDRLSDLAVVNKTGAESIKKSMEAMNEQNKYIKDLTYSMRQKDSLNLVLVMNLKRSLADIDDEDINIEVKKGVVYISLSDKLLFKSGNYELNQKAEEVLAKIAKVLNDHKALDILVEGHTDNVPISTACMSDNWDLSVKRATTVVRHLQTKHNIDPARMTAGGRSEYISKTTNETVEGKSINRRTEIIILPKLDEFFELLEPPTN